VRICHKCNPARKNYSELETILGSGEESDRKMFRVKKVPAKNFPLNRKKILGDELSDEELSYTKNISTNKVSNEK
jgi:hypothetical protein